MGNNYIVPEEKLTSLANNVRVITKTEDTYSLDEINSTLAGIAENGIGTDTTDATATASDILSGKTAYVNDEKITGTIATKTVSDLSASGATVTVPAGYYASQATKSVSTATQATPTVSIDSAGKITASATQTAGYVSAGTKSATKQLTTQAAKTVTPTTSNQIAVAKDRYTTGAVTVAGDTNLVAGNIKSGVSIFGVAGSYEGSEGGGTTSSAKWNDVTFIDYDGSILYSYSLAEAQALTELPALPSHGGLVCQGWNWTLEEIKALNRPVTVGAMYITDDGATRLHIKIATVGRMTMPLYIGQTVSNGVSIDWGDRSAPETLSGTGNVNTSHTYAEPGDYVISLMPDDGCTLSLGSGATSNCVIGSTKNNGIVYCNMLQDVSIGKNVTDINISTFQACYSLASITIPTSVTSIGNYAFNRCYFLASITIPTSVTSIGNYAFNNCYSLASITIPTSVTSININAFNNCYSLASITIPTSVTSIGTGAFYGCYGMRYYDFSACTTIPALSNTNAFKNIRSDCQMLIPSALYNNWSTATNWTTYASYMVAV